MDDSSSFGYWIRRRRKALDLTQDDLAEQVGCARVTIRKIEADVRRPSRQIAERLAECLQIPLADRVAFLQAARAELAVDRLTPPPDPSRSSPPPRRTSEPIAHQQAIKGYLLSEQIGVGGFGAVYRAVQPGIGREVAVKVIRPEYANLPDFIRRFEAEAQLIAHLEHPYIVPLYDYWREPNGAYLVMRYIRGGSLHAALRSGSWALDQTARLLEQIGSALAFAHRHAVVHRDLKPANVLLDEDGSAYLADFGIAKDLRAATAVGETQPGAMVGSLAYLAPEQLRDEPVTPQTDIYSLGVLLYEVLTGSPPFSDLPLAARLDQQLHTPLPPLATRRPDLPATLNALVQRATAKAPDDRYPDILSLVADWPQPLANSAVALARPAPANDGSATTNAATLTDFAVVENPYKGLRAFGEADAADFFGREALTRRLLERLAEEDPAARFLAVVGPSGSGKSSVVRAGLIPALRRGGLPGSERWFIVELFPGAHPLEELEAALLRIAVNPPESLLGQLREDERGLARAVKRVLPEDSETELALVIDQFEELFTLTQDEGVRAHVLKSLAAAIFDPRSRVRVIVTLRADFTGRPLQYVEFGALLRERTEFVLPLAPSELEQAIASPARRVGMTLDPQLVVAIDADVSAQPGALPLLQYALTQLFERRQGRLLTLATYRESGGIHGALARRADALYSALDAAGQAAARQLFLRLITLGDGVEDTRRRTLRAELTTLATDAQPTLASNRSEGANGQPPTTHDDAVSPLAYAPSALMEALIDQYGRARLLSFDHDPITRGPTVEITHEALLRAWDRLRTWIEASRADVRMQRLLGVAATEWVGAGRDPSYLLSGARLTQFEGWAGQSGLALTHDECAFLEASLTERDRQDAAERDRQQRELATAQQLATTEQQRADEQSRAAARLRRRAILLAGALVLALLAAIVAGVFANRSATQQALAQQNFLHAETLRLAAEANNVLDRDRNGELAALLALRSLRIAYTPQGDAALLPALVFGIPRRIFVGHTSTVWKVAFSPDGKYALSGSNDQTARLWDVATGQEVRQFIGHTDHVFQVVFSPDGKQVLTGSKDKTARLWDVATGQQLRVFSGHTGWVSSVAFSPDGRSVLTTSDKIAQLWDVATGQEVRMFSGHTDVLNSVAFSPDGRSLLTGSTDKTARLWDVATGQQLRVFSGHTEGIEDVAFSPDGKQVLTASDDKTARLWDAATGQQLRVFSGHTDLVTGVAFSPDGTQVFTGSFDKTARLWDVATGQQLRQYNGHTSVLWGVAFSPDGHSVLTASNDTMVRLWDTRAETEPRTFTDYTNNPVAGIAFSPNGKQVLTIMTTNGSFDRIARLWDVVTGQQLRQFSIHPSNYYTVAFSPDGRYVLTGSDKIARLWDVATGQEVRMFSGHTDSSWGMAFSPDGRYALTGSMDNTARLWDVATGQEVRVFSGHTNAVGGGAFSPDGRSVLTGSDDKTARLWDVATGQQLRMFSGHTDGVGHVAFSPDGKYALTTSDDKTARLWDVATGQQLRMFSGHTEGIEDVAFSPDGKQVLTGSADKTARLWDVTTGQQLRVFSGHTDLVTDVAFSPDGKTVLSGSWDGTARLWRLDMQDVIRLTCAQLPRDFSSGERATYGISDAEPTCPKP